LDPTPVSEIIHSRRVPAIPGTHILANLSIDNVLLLAKHSAFRVFADKLVDSLGLVKVGEVYHDFPEGGFTGVICLAESHLSIHTWPEHGYATFDVFLSSYRRDNEFNTVKIYEAVREFFEATVLFHQQVKR